MSLTRKIVTVVYVAIQLVFFTSALVALKEIMDVQSMSMTTDICLLLIVYYTLSTSAVRVCDATIPYLPVSHRTGVTDD